MNIYITDKKNLTKYKLPEKIEESFLFSHKTNGKNEYQISLIYQNDKLNFKNDTSVYLQMGQQIPAIVTINDYDHYEIKFKNNPEKNYIYFAPSKDTITKRLGFNKENITIGNNTSCNICYKDELTLPTHASIVLNNNEWYITSSKDENCYVYLNNKRISSEKLKTGDVIFINGLRIIWMGNFIKINNPKNKVSINGNLYEYQQPEKEDHSKYVTDTGIDANIELYKEEDYFFHRPRLRTVIEEEKVEIDAPPENQNKDDVPILFQLGAGMTILFTSVISAYNSYAEYAAGKKTLEQIMPRLILCASMLIFSFLLPRIMKLWQKRRRKKREAFRQRKYKQYLSEKTNEINLIMNKQSQILKENNLTIEECAEIVLKNKRKIWEREIDDNDFLTVRLGTGNIDAKLTIDAPRKHFKLDEDNLENMIYEIVEQSKELQNVPITISFIENKISAIVTECSFDTHFMNSIILQLITYHSSTDLKIVFMTNKENEKLWEYMKILPHCWSNDKSLRYFATNLEEMKTIINELEKEFNERKTIQNDGKSTNEVGEKLEKTNVYKNFDPYYIIITDDFKTAKQIEFINLLLNIKENYGYSLLLLEKSMQNLPNVCNTFTYVMDSLSCVFHKELSSDKQTNFNAEYNPTIDMQQISKELANIPITGKEGLAVLPQSLAFLEMYKVGKIEQLNILNRWKTSNPIATLQTPIGVHPNGDIFKLDLHEKFHGPHGLIAGSTGSGKSEFIITYLLSLAINYHPYEVQFVLIDYKGGGLAGAFENRETGLSIPHLAGTITNLDTSEMNRTLVSIESELKRRQRIFNEVRDSLGESTIDIYKYQRLYREGAIKEPVSHLFIVSDEFAELKSQQPEFLNQLVSTARIGRSLGVHLILATQKPAGVVNDQIWSNSKFKVCLKVQTRQDSMEMLKRAEAASIKETGRFYLQVGYDELFEIGQSGWSGAKYIPSEKVNKKVDDSIHFINNNGYIIKSINDIVKKETTENHGEQLTNIVKYLANLAEKENIKQKKLWLESIPEFIYISNLKIKYKHTPQNYLIEPIIGEYDNPSNQTQGLLKLDLTNDGNISIYGAVGSGKENLLTTIITSSVIEHTPDEINFYILDFGSETLKKFSNMPHVGDVMFSDESEKINTFISMLENEMNNRKDLFSEYSGNYNDYIKESGKTLPIVTTIINSYDVFTETYGRLEERLTSLLRDGTKYGLNFIYTTTSNTGIRIRLQQYFNKKFVLQMPQDQDYRMLLGSPKGLYPARKFGRGLTIVNEQPVEFQTAYICNQETINQTIREISKKLSESYTTRATKVPILPNVVLAETLIPEVKGLNAFPIGIKKKTLQTATFNFEKPNVIPILSNSIDELTHFTKGFIDNLKKIENLKINVFDIKSILEDVKDKVTTYSNNNYLTTIQTLQEIANTDADTEPNMIIITGIGEYKTKLKDDEKKLMTELLSKINNCKNTYITLIDEYSSYKTIEIDPWYRNAIDKTTGIWLGDGAGIQISIKINNMSLDEKKIIFPYMAYAVSKGKHTLIKYMIDKEELTNEE